MRHIRLFVVAAAVASALALPACGGGGESGAAPAATAAGSPALTAYQRAYLVVCDGATEGPPTDAPTRDPRPLVEIEAWRAGFCEGPPGIERWRRSAQAVAAATDGDRAREALTANPPDCDAVAGTPVERFCP
jgi:hypothetical protein